mgnify:CR=1 FL=1
MNDIDPMNIYICVMMLVNGFVLGWITGRN